jgi:tellurite resistance protein TehA-like permease
VGAPLTGDGADATRVDLVGVGLWAFGLYQIALALFMVVAPGTFFSELASFGTRNDHFIQDLATFELPLGVLFLVAAFRPPWRVPALTFGVLHWALHSLSHLLDIGEADPEWLGTFDFVAITIGTAVLGWLLWRAVEDARAAGRP